MRQLKKVSYERGDKIYNDQEQSETIYFIHKGEVKLFAENDYYFAIFRAGETFGDTDVYCETKRNGTASVTSESC